MMGPLAEWKANEIMSDLDSYVQALYRWEGRITWMYLDTRGLVTTGIGNLLKTSADALKLPWMKVDGSSALTEQVNLTYVTVSNMKPGMPARNYKLDLTLSDQTVGLLASTRLGTEFLPGLHRLFPGFDTYPLLARTVLVDMAYNLGISGIGRFSHLIAACTSRDWLAASNACSVKTSRPERNDWRKAQFQAAAQGTAAGT